MTPATRVAPLTLLALLALCAQAHGGAAPADPVIQAKPVGSGGRIDVFTSATAANPYRFKEADFPFTDADGDELQGITIAVLPDRGTMMVGTAAAVKDQTVTRADIPTITWHPPTGLSATETYTLFNYRVQAGDETSDAAARIIIDLEDPTQIPASGAPTVAATTAGETAHNEDVELTASTTGITELNGIDTTTLEWEWQQAAAADGDYTAIADADAAAFTPEDDQVGEYLRACATFDDLFPTPASNTLCSAGTIIANINDAPTSQESRLSIFTTHSAANPYYFTIDNFPYIDQDDDDLVSVTFNTAPTKGTVVLRGSAVTTYPVTATRADIVGRMFGFYPEAGQNPTSNYALITWNLADDGSDPDTSTNTTGSLFSSIFVGLVVATPVAASGQPAITGTAEQKATLTAGTGTVADDNGINQATIAWQWQQAAPASGGGAPAADSTDWADIADATIVTFAPTQAQVAQYVRVCMTFTDNHSTPTNEGPLCSTATGPIADVNDAPEASDRTHNATTQDGIATITPAAFTNAYTDADGDNLASVTITELPPTTDGTLHYGNMGNTSDAPVTPNQTLNAFDTNTLTFAIAENIRQTTLKFTLNDGTADSNEATLTISFGKNIAEQEVVQVSAILTATALTNANTAISGAIAAPATDLSLDGTSLMGTAQTLHQSNAPTNPHHAWYLGTTANWEYTAAYNASDNSAESLLHRLQSMANGDIALNYSLTDTSNMRFWARYQSLDINGNEGEMLEYDGSGTGFYLGADNQITETMRIGLAIGTDSSDISIDLDDDKTNAKDEATRSATSFYPYLHIDLGNNNNARVIAGFGSGTLDIKSTANSNSTASADLSWNMLAASISHHRQMKGNLSARFDGSLQLGNTSTDETTFSSGSTLMAADSSTNELSINAELRYQSNNITPFASLAARKLGGDLSQSLAMDLGLGADLQTGPAIIRLSITRQINDTTHQRHSISIDASTRPSASGISASLGSRYDSITGKPQWQSTIGWQRRNFQTSLQASPGDYRLQARLRW